MGDYYKFKDPKEIDYCFNNNLDIQLKFAQFKDDVFWDLGLDLDQFTKSTDSRD